MTDSSVAPAVPTREARGLELYRERSTEIRRLAGEVFSIPSRTHDKVNYLVDLAVPSCECPDFVHRVGAECLHIHAATLAAAKSAPCAGCGERHLRRDLVELHEGMHDNLTHFHGDRVCRPCARRAGVSY